jgi:hypothetical protein
MRDYATEIRPVLLPWLLMIAKWDAFCTFTFELPVSVQAATRQFEKWEKHSWNRVPCFYAVEWHGQGHQAHVHALMALGLTRRKEVWKDWFNRFGRNRLVPISFVGGAAGYCAKYCVKEAYQRGWWNCLQIPRSENEFHLQLDNSALPVTVPG